jgi:hypothetical protein
MTPLLWSLSVAGSGTRAYVGRKRVEGGAIRNAMDPETEEKRQEAMAPFIESIGADGVYEVIERIGFGSTASVGGAAPA